MMIDESAAADLSSSQTLPGGHQLGDRNGDIEMADQVAPNTFYYDAQP